MVEVTAISSIADDEFEDGAVLLIEKAFSPAADKYYRYAAVKTKGLWYVTGRTNNGQGMAPGDFIQWLLTGSRLMPMPRLYWAKTVYEI